MNFIKGNSHKLSCWCWDKWYELKSCKKINNLIAKESLCIEKQNLSFTWQKWKGERNTALSEVSAGCMFPSISHCVTVPCASWCCPCLPSTKYHLSSSLDSASSPKTSLSLFPFYLFLLRTVWLQRTHPSRHFLAKLNELYYIAQVVYKCNVSGEQI